jgi:hypothetical protein
MNSSSQGPGSKQQLSERFTVNLNAYALAAGAAGVSLLAMIQPAEADVVYTPANQSIPTNQFFSIDLNHDGSPDFRFLQGTFHYHNFTENLSVWPLGRNRIAQSSKGFAAALPMGASIGPHQTLDKTNRLAVVETRGFQYGSTYTGVYTRHVYGPWAYAQNRYLGVGFTIDGTVHYGWIRISVVLQTERFQATITGYAYETVANQTIHAGQLTEEASLPQGSAPVAQRSLGMLALGSPGLDLWRREDSSLSVQ